MRARPPLLALLLPMLALSVSVPEAQQQRTMTVRYVDSAIPADPAWSGWEPGPSVEVPLAGQTDVLPANLTPSIKQLTVKAVHNEGWIAFLLRWKDATKNSVMYTDTFRDAVALMVPVGRGAPITMGSPDAPVLILHWKADWQEDIDKTFQDVAQLYPNAWLDWYPFAPGEPPFDIRTWTNPEAKRYLSGWVLGNVRSQPAKRTPVEEQIAEGPGSLTTTGQNALGKGVYVDGEWRVVITRPLASSDPHNPAWGPGKTTPVAFAAWDGAEKEIGSRKGISSNWIMMRLNPLVEVK